MAGKEFYKTSLEHGEVKAGTKVKLVKNHHEVGGILPENTTLNISSIAHYPTRYLLKDEDGRIWTVPVHSVQIVSE